MYTTTSEPQEGSTCKDSHAKYFKTPNSTAKLSPGAMFPAVFPLEFLLWMKLVLYCTVQFLTCSDVDSKQKREKKVLYQNIPSEMF